MDLDGNEVSLKQFEGKPVVLNFWATWCPPCRNEMPEFNELDKQFKKTNEAVLLMINMTDGRRDTKENVEKFMKRNNFDMKVLLDTEGNAAQLYNIRYLPTTYIINSKGVVSGTLTGGTDKANVLKMLKGIK
jgi:peroxiredoxin